MTACFDDLLLGQGEGSGWRQPRDATATVTTTGAGDAAPAPDKVKTSFSVSNAKLWGGNLTVLTTLLGTPYFPDIKGGILFLEDVGEHPYRIERRLTQLLYAGVLARQKAIVLGQFTEFKLVPHDRGFKLQSVVDWLKKRVKVPILTNC